MKAIILSAGRGARLRPLTAARPKCLLPVQGGSTLLDVQLQTLAACGIREATVLVGFGAHRVESHLEEQPPAGISVRTLYNPWHSEADNLVTCWVARSRMRGPFLLLNGDTLFERTLLQRLLASRSAALTLAVDRKASYDADDMKVKLRGTRLLAVGKTLPAADAHAESIGLMLFRDRGPALFRDALRAGVCEPGARRAFYLSAVDRMARTGLVETRSIHGLRWWEIDEPEDLARVRAALADARCRRRFGARPRALAA